MCTHRILRSYYHSCGWAHLLLLDHTTTFLRKQKVKTFCDLYRRCHLKCNIEKILKKNVWLCALVSVANALEWKIFWGWGLNKDEKYYGTKVLQQKLGYKIFEFEIYSNLTSNILGSLLKFWWLVKCCVRVWNCWKWGVVFN